jgi:uncharacterized protein (TIGR03000 family)
MSWYKVSVAGVAVLALALFAVPANAQHGGHGGGGHGGGGHGGGGHGGGFHGGGHGSGFHGSGFHGSGFHGSGFHGRGLGWGGWGWGLGYWGYPGYYYGGGYGYSPDYYDYSPTYYYDLSPSVYSYSAPAYGYASPYTDLGYSPSLTTQSFYNAPLPADTYGGSPGYGGADANAARVRVRVPPGTTVWFDGDRTSQTGTERNFVSPPLEPGRGYTYEVRARWMEGNRPMEDTRQVRVRAGETTTVDFLSPAVGRDRDLDRDRTAPAPAAAPAPAREPDRVPARDNRDRPPAPTGVDDR